jgi:hypothetical protein
LAAPPAPHDVDEMETKMAMPVCCPIRTDNVRVEVKECGDGSSELGGNIDLSKLSQLWGEVSFILKVLPTSARNLAECEKQSERGAAFLSMLFDAARRLNMRKGALSRAILPFDDQTSLADQVSPFVYMTILILPYLLTHPANVFKSNLGNRRTRSLEAQDLLTRGAVTESTLDEMTREAVSLR